jgi:hypothetical protein
VRQTVELTRPQACEEMLKVYDAGPTVTLTKPNLRRLISLLITLNDSGAAKHFSANAGNLWGEIFLK